MILSNVGASGPEAGTKSAVSEAKLQEDLNRFLTLLVTQLKNQDPLDPLDANEFTSQLVQFASVEQQIYQNANLEKLLKVQQTSQISAMVGFIGKTIEAEGRSLPLQDGKAGLTYALPSSANSAKLIITDANGRIVLNRDVDGDAGRHSFTWDGRDEFGIRLPDGTYTVLVSALDRSGKLLEVNHTVSGRVTGAAGSNGSFTLHMGDVEVDFDKVLAVQEPPPAGGA
jgi:flagellar basal-body rod modification protein FlgD